PEPDAAEVPAAAAAAEVQAKARRRRKAKTDMLGRGYEYMDLDDARDAVAGADNTDPPGAEHVLPSGLTALAGDAFGEVTAPMTPGTWTRERRKLAP
ncbi:hypothetical protein ABQF47_21225, partial [Mycolicibacter sinensis]